MRSGYDTTPSYRAAAYEHDWWDGVERINDTGLEQVPYHRCDKVEDRARVVSIAIDTSAMYTDRRRRCSWRRRWRLEL